MLTASCRSSNGRSRGPESQITSLALHPAPNATKRQVIATLPSLRAIFPKSLRPPGAITGPACRKDLSMTIPSASPFARALLAPGPAPDRADKLALYGWLVGYWVFDVVAFDERGGRQESRGEIYAGWVLEGRAIQDVWMIPPRTERHRRPESEFAVTGAWYGTTLRVYDPSLDAWHIHWIDPATQFQARMIGRARDTSIVQEGALPSGALLRW